MHWTSRERHSTDAEAELLHALLALAEQLQSNLDVDAVVRAIATSASSTFGYREACVLVRDRDEFLRPRAVVGAPASADLQATALSAPVSALERLMTGRRQIGPGFLVEGGDPAWERTGLEALATRGAPGRHEGWNDGDTLFIPFRDAGGELGGVLCLGSPRDEAPPAEDQSALLGIFATHAATALANAREHQQLRQVTDELAVQLRVRRDLADMSSLMLSTLDPEMVYEKSARALARIVPFDVFGIALFEEERTRAGAMRPSFTAPDPAPGALLGVLDGSDTIAQSVMRSGEMRMYGSQAADERFDGCDDAVGEIIVAPLKTGGAVAGVITVGRRRGRTFSEREKDLFRLFVNIATIAVHNARMYQQVEHLAISDGLTGVHNYRHFREALANEVARADRYGETFCLLMMDLDHFKAVNDTVGHQQGDEVLKAVTNVLRQCSRESDYLARYGGEEFVMILPRTPLREARTVAERIRRTVRDIDPGSPVLRVSMSIGVAAYPNSNPTMDAVLRSADAALLRAKSAGRNRVYLHGEVDDRIEIADERWAELARRFAAAAHLSEAETTGLVAAIATTGLVSRPPAGADREGRRIPRTPWSPGAAGPDTMASIAMLYATEHWDGGGYPEGLRGRQIPRVARAYAVCREYLHAEQQEPRAPLRLLRARAGTVLDPGLVQRLAMALAEADGPASVSAR